MFRKFPPTGKFTPKSFSQLRIFLLQPLVTEKTPDLSAAKYAIALQCTAMLDYKTLLNPAQYEAATAPDKRLLILAGAGTGKTHTMMYKTAYLIESGVNPEDILLLTFTNKAAREMTERLERLNLGRVNACTFHSFCAAQLRKYAHILGYSRNFSILSQSDTEEIYRMFREKNDLPASDLSSLESYAVNRNISLAGAHFKIYSTPISERTSELIEKASEYRRDHDMFSYDDLLVEYIRLLKTGHVKPRYRYIMVDEYQDTNILQDMILDLIEPEYLAVVGDDCQSLYAFRGAEVTNILNFAEKHKCRTIRIEKNYRSNQDILDLTNNMMQTHCSQGLPKWLLAAQNYGEAPLIVRPENIYSEADYVFAYIKDWLDKRNPPKELCVLVRSSKSSAVLESKLVTSRIPFDKRGGPKFFETGVIKDILSLFDLTRNKKNRIAWFRSLMLLRNIGRVNAKRISEELSGGLGIEKYKNKSFYADLKELIKTTESRSEWRKRLEDICDYYMDLSLRNIQTSKSMKKDEQELYLSLTAKSYIDILKAVADAFTSESEFIDGLTTDNIKQDEEDVIVISTIHSAKGLEFEFVILVGASEGVFPREYNDDELRCMYVALTRAKSFLLITSPIYYNTSQGVIKTELPIWLEQ